jgi:hypothetical protein
MTCCEPQRRSLVDKASVGGASGGWRCARNDNFRQTSLELRVPVDRFRRAFAAAARALRS